MDPALDLKRDDLDRVREVRTLILDRGEASLADLGQELLALQVQVATWPPESRWPDTFAPVSTYSALRSQIAAQWPELGFYDVGTGESLKRMATPEEVPAEIGDALNDLSDVANDFAQALRLAEEDAVGARDLLRFTMQTHWGEHVQDLGRHLATLTAH